MLFGSVLLISSLGSKKFCILGYMVYNNKTFGDICTEPNTI